jgi:hypothetical protein
MITCGRGEFTFETNVADTGSTEGYNRLSLQVALGNVMLPAEALWEDN